MASLLDLFVKIGAKDEASGTISKAASNSTASFSKVSKAAETAATAIGTTQSAFSEATDGADEFADTMKSTGNEIEDLASTSQLSFDNIGKAVVAGFSTAKIIEFGKTCITTAASVNSSVAQFTQTFTTGGEDVTEAAQQVLSKVADSSGILETRLRDSGTKIYAFAKSSGASTSEAMALMEEALTLAADSAAYYDKSLEETTATLQSFLKGNYENDAALGVSATETTRNAAAMELFGDKFQNLTEIQKQKTLLKMVSDSQKLSGAMGQAAREADNWENVTGNLKQAWTDLIANLGTPMLEAAVPVVKFLSENVEELATAAVPVLIAVLGGLAKSALPAATAAVKSFTAALATNPVILAATAVAGLVYVVEKEAAKEKEAADATEQNAKAFAEQYETASEARAALEQITKKLDDYEKQAEEAMYANENLSESFWLTYDDAEQKAEALKKRIEELSDVSTQVTKANKKYTESYTSLVEKATNTYKQNVDSLTGWFNAFESAAYDTSKSLDDFYDGLLSQAAYYNEYADNMEYLLSVGLSSIVDYAEGLGQEGAQFMHTFVEEFKAAGGMATKEGRLIAQDAEQNIADYKAALERAAQAFTTTTDTTSAEFDKIAKEYIATIDYLDQSEGAYESAKSTILSLAAGYAAARGEVVAQAEDIMRAIRVALSDNATPVTLRVNVETYTTKTPLAGTNKYLFTNFSQRAIGLDYVPYNGYPAMLHRGETVLTAQEAGEYRKGNRSTGGVTFNGGITVNYTGSGVAEEDVKRIAEMLQFEIEKEAYALG